MNNETTASLAESRTRRRRVPEEQRKRGAQSCDLCRKKRCKCIVPSGASQQCMNCLAQGASCTYTLPRKTRLYGSVEDLSDRFRCLEALVQGAFPTEALGSVQELMDLGHRRGYAMPALSKESGTLVSPDVMLQNNVPSHPTPERSKSSESSLTERAERNDFLRVPPRPSAWNVDRYTRNSDSPSLVRDASGREHYIGPSGGLQFLGQLRRALLSRDQFSETGFPIRSKAASSFVEDDGAQLLENDDPPQETAEASEPATAETGTLNHYSPASAMTGTSDATAKSTIDVDHQWRQLPSADIVAKLLNSYFRNVHCDFPLFHQGTFEEEFETRLGRYRSRARTGAGPSQPHEDTDLGWLGCLQMMIAFGSMKIYAHSKDETDNAALIHRCVANTKAMLPYLVSKCTLNNLRALFLFSHFLHNNNERNSTWNLIGTAVRIAFAMGLHQDSTSASFRPIEREVRKRVLCTLYNFEQFLSNSLGRPSALTFLEMDVIPPREDLLGGGGGGDASLLPYTLRLYRLMGEVTVAQSKSHDDMGRGVRSANAIMQDLRAWNADVAGQQGFHSVKSENTIFNEPDGAGVGFDDLKAVLRWQSSSKLREMLLVRMNYHYIVVLNTRPFLLHQLSTNKQPGPRSTPNDIAESGNMLADLCVQNAGQLAMYILLLDSFGLVNGMSGLEMFYFYWACMILCLAALRRSLVSNEGPSSEVYMGLAAQLRGAAAKVDQCGTMKRFTQLMGAFTEYINHRCAPPRAQSARMKSSNPGEGNEPAATVSGVGNIDPTVENPSPGQDTIGPYYRPSGGLFLLGDTIEGGVGVDAALYPPNAWGGAFTHPNADPNFMTHMMDYGNYEGYAAQGGDNRRWP